MDRDNKTALKQIRKLSFLQFSIQRSMDGLRIGSNPWTMVSPEWTAQLRLRNRINCGRRSCDQMQFNEDGSLLVMADVLRGRCRLFDTKLKQLVNSRMIDVGDQWRLSKVMMSAKTEVVTLCTPQLDSRVHVMFWDLRNTRQPVSSSFLDGQTTCLSSLYSKKDDMLLIMNPSNHDESLAVFNRDGVKQHTGSSETAKLTKHVKNIALSPDESILVMETTSLSYIIVRQLNLETLFQDLEHMDHLAVLAEGRGGSNDENSQVRSRARSSRNVPEIMNHTFTEEVLKCVCHRCNRAVLFTPESEVFVGHNTYCHRDESGRGREKKSQVTLLFDLREHHIYRQRSPSFPGIHYNNERYHLGTKTYLNQPMYEIKMDSLNSRPNSVNLKGIEPKLGSCCTIAACQSAVTTLLGQTLVALAADCNSYINFYIFNAENVPVQELEIDLANSIVSNMVFSPNNFSLVVTDLWETLHWYDIEHSGPLPNSVRGVHGATPFNVIQRCPGT